MEQSLLFPRPLSGAILLLLLALPSHSLVRSPEISFLDQRTNFSSQFLSRACAAPLAGAWAHCVAGGGDASGGDASTRPGRAYVVPPLPRYAVLNPMHALVDHVWAYATQFSACGVGDGGSTIVLMGVRRSQVDKFDVEKDLTVNLDTLDLHNELPLGKGPDTMGQAPTWGQWLMYFWAKGVVGAENLLFEDDVSSMAQEGLCFEDGVLATSADFFGTTNRAMRLEFIPEGRNGITDQAVPWPDFPERWKRRGLQKLRRAVAEGLRLDTRPRRREGDENIRVLVTTRQNDLRRRWQNSDEAIKALVKEFGNSMQVRVLHNTKGMSFQEQAKAYNWADILVGIHGASQANSVFMRDGSGVVEVWRCCHEDLSAQKRPIMAWTGWLLERMSITLKYVGCTEVTHNGEEIVLSNEDQGKSVQGICNTLEHLNARSVAVESSSLSGTVRRTNWEAKETYGQEPVPELDILPEIWRGKFSFQTRPATISRRYAPRGPGWSECAVGSERLVSLQVKFDVYLRQLSARLAQFWRNDSLLSSTGLDPLPIDSIVEVYDELQDRFAWHVDFVPGDGLVSGSTPASLLDHPSPGKTAEYVVGANNLPNPPFLPGQFRSDNDILLSSTDAKGGQLTGSAEVIQGRRLDASQPTSSAAGSNGGFYNLTSSALDTKGFGSDQQWSRKEWGWATVSRNIWFLYLVLIIAFFACMKYVSPFSSIWKSSRNLCFLAQVRGGRQRSAFGHVSTC